ncbi:glycosyltransferase family 2 protein [Methylococcus sp. EFPC2]|uniref:glycosyltransferase family 2 protein n=1 Tax=Methylococcus sp. EFPC2 TaxID=2812648 RepID=UPI0019687576|nr:glycosyltransferase family 2 protein [Methylococcus sp. EFPC2]QSA98462.1 glycosyltransferase family 2 protein [Methylococcus sp. EFPC2]
MSVVTIIIVNWNASGQLARAVASIAEHHEGVVEAVIVIDNASRDNSLDHVEAMGKLPFPLKIIRNSENLGFAAACNQGAAIASTPYLLFLNPDTRLFAGSLSTPNAFMGDINNLSVGVSGIQLIDEEGRVARSCARFPTPLTFILQSIGLNKLQWFRQFSLQMTEWNHTSTQTVDHVIGAFFLVRRSLFEQLQGFDPRFFVYLEDLDFSRRAASFGYKSVYLASARAFHAGGGTSSQVKAARLFYSLRSRLFYSFKHFSLPSAWLVLLFTIIAEPFSRLAFSLLQGSRRDAAYTLIAYGSLLKALPSIIRTNCR